MTITMAGAEACENVSSMAHFYRELVQRLPFGLAILHLRDPHRTLNWELLAQNPLAERIVGSDLADYLELPALAVARKNMPLDIAAAYRGVAWYGRVVRLGHISVPTRATRRETYIVKAYPYPNNCVGVVVDVCKQKRSEADFRRLSLQVMRAQEQERKRISRELHDSVGQCMTGIQWSLSNIRRDQLHGKQLARRLGECIEMVKDCVEELRSVCYALQPPALEMLGLTPALKWQAQRFSEQSGLRIELRTPAKMERFGADTELALFRVFQECLSNVRRHAKVDSAQVRLSATERDVALEVEDKGVGAPDDILERTARSGCGIGLLKMRERIGELGGTLAIESTGRGTLVRARVPRTAKTGAGEPVLGHVSETPVENKSLPVYSSARRRRAKIARAAARR